MTRPTCSYFLLCTNPADAIYTHPALGAVPTCYRCADRVELPRTELTALTPDDAAHDDVTHAERGPERNRRKYG